MWKKVCCAALVSVSRQVEELRSVKAAFLRGQRGGKHLRADEERSHDVKGEGGPCAMGAISRPSNCSPADAVHLWEATYVRKCLGSGAPGDLTCTPKCPALEKKRKKKNLRDVPGLVVLTHSALLYNSSCGIRCRPLTLSQSVSLAPSPASFLFRFYQFFFNLIFFPLSTSPPASITSITRLSHPSVVLPAYPGLLLFFS